LKFAVFKNERGLTLIEVLVAFVILTMTLVTMMDSFALGGRQNAGNYRYNAAMTLAQSKMEEIKNKPFNSVVSIALTYFSTETDYSQFPGFSYAVTVENDGLNHKKVTVAVYYSEEGVSKTFDLTSGITKR